VNPTGATGTGITTLLAAFVPFATGLKYSVSICGDTGSKSLAEGVGVAFAGDSAVETFGGAGGAGSTAGAAETAFVCAEVAVEIAVSGAFVGDCRSTSISGRVSEAGTALSRENLSGDGPVFFK